MARYLISPSFVISEDGRDYAVPRDDRDYARKANDREAAVNVIGHLAREYASLSEGNRLVIDVYDTKDGNRYEVFAGAPAKWNGRKG